MAKLISTLSITLFIVILAMACLVVAADATTWDITEALKGAWKIEHSKFKNDLQDASMTTDGMMLLDTSTVSGLRGNFTEEVADAVKGDENEDAEIADIIEKESFFSDLRIIATSPRTGTFRFLKHTAEASGLLDEQDEQDDVDHDLGVEGLDNILIEFDYAFDISALSGFAVSQGTYRDAETKTTGVYDFTFVNNEMFILTLTQQTDDKEYKISRYIGKKDSSDAKPSFFSRYGSTIMLFVALFLPRLLGQGFGGQPAAGGAGGAAEQAQAPATAQQ